MKYFTQLGDGLIFLPLIVLALLFRFRYAIELAMTGIFLTVVVNILKQVVFTDTERPKRFFQGIVELNMVPGIDMHGLNSFPSGHTATAAAIAVLIALEWKNKTAVFASLIFAVLIGFSRIYLAQHFLRDVVFGYLVGVVVATAGYYIAQYALKPYSFADKSLIRS
jgi:membrane-associated phospholipid phosphatase